MSLAAACLYTVYRQGPKEEKYFREQGMDASHPSPEQEEAAHERFSAELFAALEFCADLAAKIFDGSYDEHFEDRLGVLFQARSDGDVAIRRIMGFRGPVATS